MPSYEQTDLFGDQSGKTAPDNSQWLSQAIDCVRQLPSGWTGLPEDWRFVIIHQLGHPHDEHTWGSLTKILKARAIVRKTGKRRKMQALLAHSRETDEYERC